LASPGWSSRSVGLTAFAVGKSLSPFPQWFKSITDGAHAAMMNAIRHDETPNFYFLQYKAKGAPRKQRLETIFTSSCSLFAAVGFVAVWFELTRCLDKPLPESSF
jgi:hypothetical protein